MSMAIPILDEEKRKQIQQIVSESGHNTQLRIEAILRSQGWEVTSSPYYPDRATKKQREIDIVAKKIIDITSGYSGRQVRFEILVPIECRYLKVPIVFGDTVLPTDTIERVLSSQVSDPDMLSRLTLRHSKGKFFNKQQAGTGGYDLYEQINKVTSVVDQEGGLVAGSDYRYIFPMIVVEGDQLYTFDMQQTNHIIYYVNYQITVEEADDSQREYFVDIVTVPSFGEYLVNDLEDDLRKIESKINDLITFKDRDRDQSRKIRPSFE